MGSRPASPAAVRGTPRPIGPLLKGLTAEPRGPIAAKSEDVVSFSHLQAVIHEEISLGGRERRVALAYPRLQLDLALILIPALLHPDGPCRKVDAAPAERLQLATTQTAQSALTSSL